MIIDVKHMSNVGLMQATINEPKTLAATTAKAAAAAAAERQQQHE